MYNTLNKNGIHKFFVPFSKLPLPSEVSSEFQNKKEKCILIVPI
jgi:hypothetical protein